MGKAYVVAVFLGVFCLGIAHAAIPLMINHQGIVKVNGEPFTGNGLFKFGFMNSTGIWLWTNDGTHLGESASVSSPDGVTIVPVNNGVYNVRLGDVSALGMVAIPASVFAEANVFLRVIFNDGTTGEQVLAPDQVVSSAPYAYHAADAETLGGKTAEQLALTGEVRMWAGNVDNVPDGWLFCDGRAVSRSTYSALFSVIGTIYGPGNGTTTFNLPDFRDRSPVGARQDDAGVPKTNVAGVLTQTGGEAAHTLSEAELPSHAHAENMVVGTTIYPLNSYRSGTNSESDTFFRRDQLLSYVHAQGRLLTDPVGNGVAHNNMPPFFAISFIIKQ